MMGFDSRSRHLILQCTSCGKFIGAWQPPDICSECGNPIKDLITLVYEQDGDSGEWEVESIERIHFGLGGETVKNGDRTFKYIDKERFVPWLEKLKEREIKKAQLDVNEAKFCAGRVQLIDSILEGSTHGWWDWQPSQ